MEEEEEEEEVMLWRLPSMEVTWTKPPSMEGAAESIREVGNSVAAGSVVRATGR